MVAIKQNVTNTNIFYEVSNLILPQINRVHKLIGPWFHFIFEAP